MTIRKLSLVNPGDEAKPAAYTRHEMGKMLRRLAQVAERGSPYIVDGTEHRPPAAVVVVFFDTDGEPLPVTLGVEPVWRKWEDWLAFTNEVALALRDFRDAHLPPRVILGGVESEPDDLGPYERLRQAWHQREESTARVKALYADLAAKREAEYPILCDCGKRCKTIGGLRNHERSRQHRWWVSRQKAKNAPPE